MHKQRFFSRIYLCRLVVYGVTWVSCSRPCEILIAKIIATALFISLKVYSSQKNKLAKTILAV